MRMRLQAGLMVVLLGSLAMAPAMAEQTLPSFAQVRANFHPSDGVLLDRHGEPLADIRFDPNTRRMEWQTLGNLPLALREALLAAEDKRFFEHTGVDWMAVAGAAWQNLWGSHKRGASTLTMQLAGLLEPSLRMPNGAGARRSMAQKWDQGLAAVELEEHWSKPQILEAYLNLAPFRGDLQGVGAASELLFGLQANAMTRKEACILAALLRGPNAPPPLVAKRACLLANKLGDGLLCTEITQLAKARLDQPRGARYTLAPHLAHLLLKHPGQKLTSNLDAGLQRKVVDEINTWSDPAAAAIVLDNATGEVLAWVGGQNLNHPDGVSSRHPVTDWAWPHLAALALERRQITAATPLTDISTITDANDARLGYTWHTLRTALNQRQTGSLRQLIGTLGRDPINERLRALGFDPAETSVEGNTPLSLTQLASAWRTLAANGSFVPARILPSDNGIHNVLRPEAAFVVEDMLGQAHAGGWDASWIIPGATTGQTVIIGNTDRYTLAIRGAMPAPRLNWQCLLKAIGADTARAPTPTDGVVQNLVYFDPAEEAPRREWFLRHADLSGMVSYLPNRRARIVEPENGTTRIIGNEPDAHWTFLAQGGVPVRWILDGRQLGEGMRIDWSPRVGLHRLSLRSANDEQLDNVEFLVTQPEPSDAPDEERP
ncbi:transglycosylase domain-containing protein [Uliginosibacterium gangwonense]|uniref:transglycosylase domain-containing protein n=1 Tax=Uliginosibacterium gangwonense TaxID=392736 RepID=UPI00036358F0|nr:transglycosylase domain-containing protein [Uliginosibacterium gangwonense]